MWFLVLILFRIVLSENQYMFDIFSQVDRKLLFVMIQYKCWSKLMWQWLLTQVLDWQVWEWYKHQSFYETLS